MSDAITSAVQATIFGSRRVNRVADSKDYVSSAVAAGQFKNVKDSIITLDHSIGRGTQSAVNAVQKICKNKPLLEYVGKGVNIASNNVNSLICLSAGVKVFNSDDKVSAAIEQGSALTAMFAAESLMKDHLGSVAKIKGVDGIAKKVLSFSKSTPGCKPVPAIIKGLAFVSGSIFASMAGEKLGKTITGNQQA